MSRSVSALDRLVRHRPRYLLHGVAAGVSVAALVSMALHPRPLIAAADVAVAAPVLDTVVPASVANDDSPTVVAAPPAAVQPVNDVLEATIAPPEPAKPVTHTVEEGETVRMLAAKYGISPETLMAANDIQDPDLLQVGQNLVILPTDGVLYTLKAGDSILKVAERFSVDPGDIIRANILGPNPDLVQPGTKLVVPGADPDSETTATDSSSAGGSDDQADTSAGDSGQTASAGTSQNAGAGSSQSAPSGNSGSAAPSTRTYEVQSGDTLAGIADMFGVDIQTILSNNGIDDPDTIHPGSDLRILPVKGIEHEVQPDETLADIAYKYQVDLGLLLDYNNLDDPDVITVGTKLVVPGGSRRAD
ncbi:MAG: LysM peptidoglycan-binding domain-containing protein, partial [Chloroflexi bacterium]|nr:LysM peptidoglycan-binding domain-containing protein [Chloroflexota bacterium]